MVSKPPNDTDKKFVDDESYDFDGSSSESSQSRRTRLWKRLRRLAVPLALGQLLSLLVCCTSITSTYLVTFDFNLPIVQNIPHYFFLALVYGAVSLHRFLRSAPPPPPSASDVQLPLRQRVGEFLRKKGWQYAIAGTIDVHANWAIVSAYRYTNMTSIQLLDCLAIPTAMVLSRLCLKTHYRCIHVLGVVVCLLGSGAMVLADYLAAKEGGGGNSTSGGPTTTSTGAVLFGDFLVIVGAVGYGASNVYQEFLVRRFGIVDYLAFVPAVASFWTCLYAATVERVSIAQMIHRANQANLGPILGCLAGFASAMFLLYTVLPLALSRTNAVLVNLSLLTADIYALLVGILLFGNRFHTLYLIAVAAILVGVCLFTSRDPVVQLVDHGTPEDDYGGGGGGSDYDSSEVVDEGDVGGGLV